MDIKELLGFLQCEKVEFKPLYELTFWDKKFAAVDKAWQPKTLEFTHILAKDLQNLIVPNGDIKLLSTGKFDDYTDIKTAQNLINEGEVLAIPSGGEANLKYYKGKFVDSGNILATARDNTNSLKFIYYYLLTRQKDLDSSFRGGSIKHPEMKKILQIPIPIPPIAIQHKIVEILDAFTELQAELQAELHARRKQYEYYRNALLSFESLEKRAKAIGGLKLVSLGELFTIKNGYTPSKAKAEFWEGGTIPWFRMEDIQTNRRILKDSIQHITPQAVKGKLFPANSIIISTTATIGEHALVIVDYLSNQRFTCLIPQVNCCDRLNMRFMFYYGFILGEWCRNNVNKSAFPSVKMEQFKKVKIPLPPLEVQNDIVEILDAFDALANDLSAGLPAEIEARQKQYEYYREKLLSF